MVKLIKATKNQYGNVIRTYELIIPKYLVAEINKHTVLHNSCQSCLSGDTLVTTDNPFKVKKGTFCSRKIPIKEICEKWIYGAKKRKRHLSISNLENKNYTAKEISLLINKNVNNIRSACRKNLVKVLNKDKKRNEDFIINGLDYNEYHNSYETHLSMRNKLKQLYIRCLNEETGEYIHTHIENCFIQGEQDLYEIELDNGYKIKCTDTHRLFTNEGWKTLKDINVSIKNNKIIYDNHTFKIATNGIEISVEWLLKLKEEGYSLSEICNNYDLNFKQMSNFSEKHRIMWKRKIIDNELLLYKDYEWLSQKLLEGLYSTEIAMLCNSTSDKIKKQIKKFGLKGNKRNWGSSPVWNKGLKYKMSADKLAKHKENMKKRIKKDSYKNTNSYKTLTQQKARFNNELKIELINSNKLICAVTGKKSNIELHHIDPIWHCKEKMFDKTNVIPLKKEVHRLIHSRNLDLVFLNWYTEGKDLSKFLEENNIALPNDTLGKTVSKGNKLVCKYFGIKNITYVGKEETYDLEVAAPFHNFVANGIVVHNSRAVPIKKVIEQVQNNPFIPSKYQKTHKGMQGKEYHSDKELLDSEWLKARDNAVKSAEAFIGLETTKQIVNRLLEPFMYVKMVITGTEWDNFFELRCGNYNGYLSKKAYRQRVNIDITDEELDNLNTGQADIHLMSIAEEMYNLSFQEPEVRDWHIPYDIGAEYPIETRLKYSASQCARISYTSIDDTKLFDIDKNLELASLLLKERHAEPFSHQAKAMRDNYENYTREYMTKHFPNDGFCHYEKIDNDYHVTEYGWCRKMRGFVSHRHILNI